MAKYKQNEETVIDTVSPFENRGDIPEVVTPVSKKSQFEVVGPGGLNFGIGGKYYNTGSENFVSQGGILYVGIAENQKAMQEIYDYSPLGSTWVKAPEGYRAKWEKFI